MKNFNKKAQGIVSFAAIIILLASILASSIYFDYSITANAVKENAIDNKPPSVQVKEVKNVEELNYLNEGWYEIKKGYAYYLESFNDYVPLYIRVMNGREQNGLLVIYADGGVYFDDSFRGLPRIQVVADEKEEISDNEETTQSQISGKFTGMEKVSGAPQAAKKPELPVSESILIYRPGTRYGFLQRTDYELVKKGGEWYDHKNRKIGLDNDIFPYIDKIYGSLINEKTDSIILRKPGSPNNPISFQNFKEKVAETYIQQASKLVKSEKTEDRRQVSSLLRNAEESNPSPETLTEIGNVFLSLGNSNTAKRYFTQALDKNYAPASESLDFVDLIDNGIYVFDATSREWVEKEQQTPSSSKKDAPAEPQSVGNGGAARQGGILVNLPSGAGTGVSTTSTFEYYKGYGNEFRIGSDGGVEKRRAGSNDNWQPSLLSANTIKESTTIFEKINDPTAKYTLPQNLQIIDTQTQELSASLSGTTSAQRKIEDEYINPPNAKNNKKIMVDGKEIELKPGEAYDKETG
ncbi:hypothetical protein J4480_03005, partial [Candidatus Woesearchaeota archaeon]|nr:hypothetical protein [Candidatus Woesearchaeota archaeon]